MKTDLNPSPLAPIYPGEVDLVLSPTVQMAERSLAVTPSSLHSTTIRFGWTLNAIKGDSPCESHVGCHLIHDLFFNEPILLGNSHDGIFGIFLVSHIGSL